MYPSGTQLKNLSNVSNVAPTKAAFEELSYNKKYKSLSFRILINQR